VSGTKNRLGGLGRGLGALIPSAPAGMGPLPTDVYFGPAAGAAPDRGVTQSGHSTAVAVKDQPVAGEADIPDRPTPGDAPRPVPGATLCHLPVEEIRPNSRQPRTVFDEDTLSELAHSIREFGVLQPVVVRPSDSGYELVMGERRLRAARLAGLDTVPAIVRSTDDDAMLRDALLENIHRAQLNPLEEAAAYQQLLEEFGATHDKLAHHIGRSRPHVSNTVRLLQLPIPVQRRVAVGVLSAGHARALLAVDDAGHQEDLAARIVAEGLSVRATEELVALHNAGHPEPRRPRRSAGRRLSAPAAAELAEGLSGLLDTPVRVDLGRRKGKITVEFASIADLERIVGVIAPQLIEHGLTQLERPNRP
jgi:ParB family transcriptional regulator, chromosome partitioning protein